MNVLPQTLLFLGIIPALILLYIALKGFEGIYKEKTIFLMFIGGIVIGVISIVVEYISLNAGAIIVLIFPVFELMFKTIILNMRRFQGKKGTPIYGLALGAGFGSIYIPYYTIITSLQVEQLNYYLLGYAFTISIGILILHATTGLLLGYGIKKFQLPKYFMISLLIYMPRAILSSKPIIDMLQYIPLIILPYSLIAFIYIFKKIKIKILEEKKTEIKKKK
ncbi:MAG: protease PrsW [Candidatus Thermoplasmatota archaeon]